MRNEAPGIVPEDGREFFYLEVSPSEGFSDVVDAALVACPEVPLPMSGGVIEEKARLRLVDGRELLAISYRGDIAGWRRKIGAFCSSTKRLFGVTNGPNLELSDGSKVDLQKANVTYEN